MYCKNLLTTESILAAGDNLTNLNCDENSQVSDENLGIGIDTWAHLAEYEVAVLPIARDAGSLDERLSRIKL